MAQQEFAQKVASINERISKLQAIEYTSWEKRANTNPVVFVPTTWVGSLLAWRR
jgi:hypothetical protein